MGTRGRARATRWPVLLRCLQSACWPRSAAPAGSSAASTSTSHTANSSDDGATSTTAVGGQEAPAGTPPYYEVKTGTVSGLGTVLVDGQGLTLYMFVPDDQRGQSTCYHACASGWPPLRLPAGVTVPVAGGQAEPTLLGTTARKDGGLQVTYNGWPLYIWVGDTEPGQATGQGIDSLGGYWYVLSPKGRVIKAKR